MAFNVQPNNSHYLKKHKYNKNEIFNCKHKIINCKYKIFDYRKKFLNCRD